MPKFRRRSREVLLSNPWYRICKDHYGLPDGGAGEYTYVDIAGSTMTIPVLPNGQLVMVRQFRYLMQRHSLEFPAGGLKDGYTPLDGAREELREEAGYIAHEWLKVGEFAPYNGVSNEYCSVFVARDLERVGAEPERTEEIEIVECAPREVRELIRKGVLWDGMTINCLALYEYGGYRFDRDGVGPHAGRDGK